MPITRPTGEQLTFNSSNTGRHVLDDYLEAAEIGGFTIAELLDQIFDNQGRPLPVEFRVTNDNIQYRVGSNGTWQSFADFNNILNTVYNARNQTLQARDIALAVSGPSIDISNRIKQLEGHVLLGFDFV